MAPAAFGGNILGAGCNSPPAVSVQFSKDLHEPASALDRSVKSIVQGVSRFGVIPKPTVIVRTIENGNRVLLSDTSLNAGRSHHVAR